MLDFIGELLAGLALEAGEEVSINPKVNPKLRLVVAICCAVIYFGLGGFIVFGALMMKADSGYSDWWIRGLVLLAGLSLIGFGVRVIRRQWRVSSKKPLAPPTDQSKL